MYRVCPKCDIRSNIDSNELYCPKCERRLEIEFEPGDRLSDFVRISGNARKRRGGMSAVYKAHLKGHDGYVALKVTHSNRYSVLANELAVLRELDHPNIIRPVELPREWRAVGWGGVPKLHVAGEPVCCIALEWMEGGSLRDWLEKDGGKKNKRKWLGWDAAIDILAQIGEALSYAHALGKIHRDIKPGNILLSVDGSHAVLSDFGIAEDTPHGTRLSKSGTGTLPYMSPEQARGLILDERSDVYSLGCVLYEMLVGRPPFTGGSTSSVREKVLHRSPLPPSRLPRTLVKVPAQVETVLMRALDKDPPSRYGTVAAFVSDLQQAVSVRRSERLVQGTRSARKSALPWYWILAALFLLSGIIGLLLILGSAFHG